MNGVPLIPLGRGYISSLHRVPHSLVGYSQRYLSLDIDAFRQPRSEHLKSSAKL